MWRILVVVLLILLPATPVLASDTASVTVNMQFSVGINNFVITYVSNTNMHLSWSYDPTMYENVMVRSSYNGFPTDITDPSQTPSDGNLVYYGAATSFDDISMNFDQNVGPIYYKIWAQKLDGTWKISTFTGSEESRVVTIMTIAAIALIATIYAWYATDKAKKENPSNHSAAAIMLHVVSVPLWIVVGVLLMNQTYTGNTYIPTAMGVVGYAFAVIELVGVLVAAGIPDRMRGTNAEEEYNRERDVIMNRIRKTTAPRRQKEWWE